MADHILPAQIALEIVALRTALEEMRQLVVRYAAFEEITTSIQRARLIAEELDRLAPDATILSPDGDFARHLDAVRAMSVRHKLGDHLATSLVGPDFTAIVQRIHSVTPVPERATALRAALASLEGLTVEFKETFPSQTHTLAKEFAALAPVGGSLFLGVADDGRVVGIDARTLHDIDAADRRLRSIAASVDPPVVISTAWLAVQEMIVCEAWVNPSEEPIHFVDGKAYLRDGSASRPARQAEVKRAIHAHAIRRPFFRIEPNTTTFLRDGEEKVVGAFAHVRVTNMSGFLCSNVRAYARFLSKEASMAIDGIMPLRWSSAPEPMSVVATRIGLRMVPDPSKIPQSFAIVMEPGDVGDIAVAVKFADEPSAWGWTGESYVNNGRHPQWLLPPGRCLVEITVRAESRDVTDRFELDTTAPLERFAILPYSATVTASQTE